MKIGIDIDDTLTNTKEKQIIYWKEFINNHPKEGYNEDLPESINRFEDKFVQVFWDTYREQLSFNLSFKEGASFYLNKLKEDGHILSVVTSRPDAKYENLHEKLHNWFNQNNIPIDILYTDVRNKGLFCKENNIDILIDDDIKHIEIAKELGVIPILFNDNNLYNGYKVTSWKELYSIIKDISNNLK